MIRTARIFLVFFDVETTKGSYADLIELLRAESIPAKTVVTSRLGTMADYLEAMQTGAYDFVAPPIDQSELDRLLHNSSSSEIRSLRATA